MLTRLARGSNNGKVRWEKGWTRVRSITEARGLSVTSEEERDLFEQLYLTMMQNRSKKKSKSEKNDKGQQRRTG